MTVFCRALPITSHRKATAAERRTQRSVTPGEYRDELDFAAGAPVKKIDLVNGTDRMGNVSSEFKSTEPYVWAKPKTTA